MEIQAVLACGRSDGLLWSIQKVHNPQPKDIRSQSGCSGGLANILGLPAVLRKGIYKIKGWNWLKHLSGLPWRSSGFRTSSWLQLQEVWVPFLVQGLRSHGAEGHEKKKIQMDWRAAWPDHDDDNNNINHLYSTLHLPETVLHLESYVVDRCYAHFIDNSNSSCLMSDMSIIFLCFSLFNFQSRFGDGSFYYLHFKRGETEAYSVLLLNTWHIYTSDAWMLCP